MKFTLAVLTTLTLTGSAPTGAFVIAPIRRNRRVVAQLRRISGNEESTDMQHASVELGETSITDMEKAVADIGQAIDASPFSPELAQAQSEMESAMTDLELALQKGSTEMLSKAERDLERAMADMEHAVEMKKQSVRSLIEKTELASLDTEHEQAAVGVETEAIVEDSDREKMVASENSESSKGKDAEVEAETVMAEENTEPTNDEFAPENSLAEADTHTENEIVVAEANPEPTFGDADPHSATDNESFGNDFTEGETEKVIAKADQEPTGETQEVDAQAHHPTKITDGESSMDEVGFQPAADTNSFLSSIPVESGDQFPVPADTAQSITSTAHDTTYTTTVLLGDSVEASYNMVGSVLDEASHFLQTAEKIIDSLSSLL